MLTSRNANNAMLILYSKQLNQLKPSFKLKLKHIENIESWPFFLSATYFKTIELLFKKNWKISHKMQDYCVVKLKKSNVKTEMLAMFLLLIFYTIHFTKLFSWKKGYKNSFAKTQNCQQKLSYFSCLCKAHLNFP